MPWESAQLSVRWESAQLSASEGATEGLAQLGALSEAEPAPTTLGLGAWAEATSAVACAVRFSSWCQKASAMSLWSDVLCFARKSDAILWPAGWCLYLTGARRQCRRHW